MKDPKKGPDHSPLLQLITHPAVVIVGAAFALSGISITSVNAYRYLAPDKGPTYVSPRSNSQFLAGSESADTVSVDGTNRICSLVTGEVTSSGATTALADASRNPKSLLGLNLPELTKKITSSGEQILIAEETTISPETENFTQQVEDFKKQKLAGQKQYAEGEYQAAFNKFQSARSIHKDSPETLIYLNNALAKQASKSYTLAVAVPIEGGIAGTNLDTSLSILRGAAHAQDDINRSGGIRGVPLTLLLVDDFENSAGSAAKVAQSLTKNQDVLGVIGHSSNDATVAARRIYQVGELPSISPVSTSASLPPGHTFAFRTIPNAAEQAQILAEYMVQQERSKVAVIYSQGEDEASNQYSQPIKDAFKTVAGISSDGGEIIKEINLDDLDDAQYDEVLSSLEPLVRSEVIDTIFLMPSRSDESIEKALKIGIRSRELSKDILILGNDAMYNQQVMDCGAKVSNLVAPVFWAKETANSTSTAASDFVDRATNVNHPEHLWDTPPNWISATTYDAVLAFSKALETNHPAPGRTNIANSLRNPQFSADGATGFIKFDNNGDRIGSSLTLLKMLPSNNSLYPEDAGYRFQPIFFD